MRYLIVVLLLLPAVSVAVFDSGRAGFEVRVNGETIPYRVFAIYAMPRERIGIDVLDGVGPARVLAPPGSARQHGPREWRLQAPATSGIYEIRVQLAGDEILLNLVVMVPATSIVDGRLNGFRIGEYPRKPLYGDPVYLPPEGFIELTEENASLRVSPHFTLSQFPAKQAGGYPKYLVLRERLLLKLELLLEYVNEQGIEADTFNVMSGFRTPFYNAGIGNVPSSRHVFGGAADIFVDVSPKDNVMDDLNGDGAVNIRDAQQLYRWANSLFGRPEHKFLVGGLGIYAANAAHGPFLHIDARGRRARWGRVP